jgi:hypothetical protein
MYLQIVLPHQTALLEIHAKSIWTSSQNPCNLKQTHINTQTVYTHSMPLTDASAKQLHPILTLSTAKHLEVWLLLNTDKSRPCHEELSCLIQTNLGHAMRS